MKIKAKQFLLPLFFSVLLMSFSCDQQVKIVEKSASADEILKADVAFSDMSRQVGMKKAFLEYIDDEGVLLRKDHMPIVGADAIDFLSSINDSGFTMTWQPSKAEIASSGDLGFTYGIYQLKAQDTVYKGTYVSIWKKQSNGSWKFVLDSGNEGIMAEN